MLGAYVSLTIGRAAGKAEGMEGEDTKMCGCQRGWQGREERIKGCRRRKDVEGPRSFCHPSFSSAPRYGRFTQLSLRRRLAVVGKCSVPPLGHIPPPSPLCPSIATTVSTAPSTRRGTLRSAAAWSLGSPHAHPPSLSDLCHHPPSLATLCDRALSFGAYQYA